MYHNASEYRQTLPSEIESEKSQRRLVELDEVVLGIGRTRTSRPCRARAGPDSGALVLGQHILPRVNQY